MNFSINDKTVIISDFTKEQKIEILAYMTFTDDKLMFQKRRSWGKYNSNINPNICMLKVINHDNKEYLVGFAGLMKEIALFCKSKGYPMSFTDKRTHYPFQETPWTDEELRELFDPNFKYVTHQIDALKAMQKNNTGLIVAPTSAGKSYIMSAFMRKTNLRCLILNDRAVLASQLADDFKEKGIDCGFVGDGKKDDDHYCVVATIQSVRKMSLTNFDCVIVDECHRSSSKTFQDFLAQVSFPYKYGFSASPSNGNKYDYAKIRQFLGSPIVRIEAETLIENEVMAKPTICLVDNYCKNGGLDYASSYQDNIVHSDSRNKKIIDIANQYDEGVGIIVINIGHGEYLEKNISGSIFLSGRDSLEKRKAVIKAFNDGTEYEGKKVRVLIGSTILTEGISIPNMKVLILGASQKAITSTIQRIGRCLRITKEKKSALFYDFVDIGDTFLYKHSKRRIAIYKKEGYSDFILMDENLKPKEENKK